MCVYGQLTFRHYTSDSECSTASILDPHGIPGVSIRLVQHIWRLFATLKGVEHTDDITTSIARQRLTLSALAFQHRSLANCGIDKRTTIFNY